MNYCCGLGGSFVGLLKKRNAIRDVKVDDVIQEGAQDTIIIVNQFKDKTSLSDYNMGVIINSIFKDLIMNTICRGDYSEPNSLNGKMVLNAYYELLR